MSNRVVCREASHAGSWYTASGRAPGRPARPPPPPPGPAPGRPSSAARPRAAAGGTRARTAAGRGPRGEGAGRRPASPPARPGRHPAGQPGAGHPHALPGVGREGELPPRQPAPSLGTRLGQRMCYPTEPPRRLLQLPGSGWPAAATLGRTVHQAPESRFLRATLRPREGRAFLSPSLPSRLLSSPLLPERRPRDPGSSQPPGCTRALLARLLPGTLRPLHPPPPPRQLRTGGRILPHLFRCSAVLRGVKGSTFSLVRLDARSGLGRSGRGGPFLGFAAQPVGGRVGLLLSRGLGWPPSSFVGVFIVTVIHERGSWRWHQHFS